MTSASSPDIDPIQRIEIDASLSLRAREAIRSAILAGQLEPGTLHSVKALADRFGVSRTPVREALIDLSTQGIVRFERNRGVRILQPSVQDLEEIVEIRLLLEPPATYRAVSKFSAETLRDLHNELDHMADAAARADFVDFMRHDRAFHSIILATSGNGRAREFVDQLRDLVVSRGNSTVGMTRSAQEIISEHRTILGHIVAGDAIAAASAMHDHIDRTGRMLVLQEGGSTDSLEATRKYLRAEPEAEAPA